MLANKLHELSLVLDEKFGKIFVHSKKHFYLFLAVFIAGCFSYGFEITNFTYSLDEELMLNKTNPGDVWLSQSRWGAALLRKYILPQMEYPFQSALLAILFLSLAYTLFVADHETTIWSKVIFGLLAISFPTFAHVQSFGYLGAIYAFSIFLILFSYYIFRKKKGEIRVLDYIFLSFLISIGIACHQSLAYILFAPLLIDFSLDALKGTFRFKNFIFMSAKAFVIVVLAIFIYFLICKVINFPTSGYIESLFAWGRYDASDLFSGLLVSLKAFFSGKMFSYRCIPFLLIPCIFIFALSKQRIISLLLMAVIIFYSLFYHFVFGYWSPSRSLMYFPIIFSGLFYVMTTAITLTVWKTVFSVIVIYIFLRNSSIVTRLFLSDYMTGKGNLLVASRVLDLVYDTEPEFIEKNIPIAFVGHIQMFHSKINMNEEMFSYSIWKKENPHRIKALLNSYGVYNFALASKEQRAVAEQYAKNMPAWPAKDSVQLKNGVLIVKFPEREPGHEN